MEATDKANKGARDDIAGIKRISIQNRWRNWEPEEPTLDTTYPFEKLTQGTTHKIIMKAIDKSRKYSRKKKYK